MVGGHLSDALRRGAGCFDQAFYVGANRFDLSYIEVRLATLFAREAPVIRARMVLVHT